MSDFISEQEILKLLKKLDHDSQESESERMGSSSEAGINIEGQIKDGYIKVEQGKIIIGNPSNGGGDSDDRSSITCHPICRWSRDQ